MHCNIDDKVARKQGLPARGHRGDAARYLDDNELNHGNFLELLIEIAKHNDTLKRHIEKSIAQSKQIKEQGSKGWGSFVSFLSATTFSSVVKFLGDSLRKRIEGKIQSAGIYSIMIDSTQDVSTRDQCCITVRYVNGTAVNEKMLALVDISCDTSADGLLQTLVKVTDENDISLQTMCIAMCV